jgi:hypothetical protein
MSLTERSKARKTNKKTVVNKKESFAVTDETPETRQLSIFTKALGATKKTELYMYDEHVYINADLVIPLLSVDELKFRKRSEYGIHYIHIEDRMFVNKYGLIKLIAESREQVAFRLQDYIFEVIYKLESKGRVDIDEVESRKRIALIMGELEIHQLTEVTNINLIKKMRNDIKVMSADYYTIVNIEKNDRQRIEKLEIEIDELQEDFTNVLNSANKLARYVRVNKREMQEMEEIQEMQGIQEEEEEEDINYGLIKENAEIAKKSLFKYNDRGIIKKKKKKTKKKKSVLEIDKKTLYFAMQSIKYIYGEDGRENYMWDIIEVLPNNDDVIIVNNCKFSSFKHFSEDYRLGDVDQDKYEYIWHHDIVLERSHFNILKKLTNFIKYADEDSYTAITDMFRS